MKKLILITASIGGCLILATALALPPGVMVREWSSHIVAGEVELPKDSETLANAKYGIKVRPVR